MDTYGFLWFIGFIILFGAIMAGIWQVITSRPDSSVILCGKCTLIYPSPRQRRPFVGEHCECCGADGVILPW